MAGALLIAAVCNGMSFYSKRVGLIDRDAYHAFWDSRCAVFTGKRSMEPRCLANATPIGTAPAMSEEDGLDAVYASLFVPTAPKLALKLVKDTFGLIVIGMSRGLIARHRATLPPWRDAWPVYLLFGDAVLGCVTSLPLNDAWRSGNGSAGSFH